MKKRNMEQKIPVYYKTSLEDVENCVSSVEKGQVTVLCTSPGGRPVYLVRYGAKNTFDRKANLSSALGASDISCFADKSRPDYRPTLLLVGATHGGEFEGTMALLNLIRVMETGRDYAGNEFPELRGLMEKITLLIIPFLNPDGRARVPFDSFVGMTFEELRYYSQGTWKDGSLCGWPECKKVHPILGHVDYLGAYYNDEGINLMHDNFFGKKAAETESLLQVCEEYVPDFSVLLHGGTNTVDVILSPAYASLQAKRKVCEASARIGEVCKREGLEFIVTKDTDCGENKMPPTSFNLVSAMHHVCGEPCVTYESNQGLVPYDLGGHIQTGSTYDEIYRHHQILFEELAKYILCI
ncbi:MAG: hypothetical protein E7286_08820 [Lachnospiraceae bacterium]|nr:hypothetical protein [Lachnospiraceae bacterium]